MTQLQLLQSFANKCKFFLKSLKLCLKEQKIVQFHDKFKYHVLSGAFTSLCALKIAVTDLFAHTGGLIQPLELRLFIPYKHYLARNVE